MLSFAEITAEDRRIIVIALENYASECRIACSHDTNQDAVWQDVKRRGSRADEIAAGMEALDA